MKAFWFLYTLTKKLVFSCAVEEDQLIAVVDKTELLLDAAANCLGHVHEVIIVLDVFKS